jgi:pimeloyl-ACP methyl ester carboxylesterase
VTAVLAYADEGTGPPIVFLHGIGSDHRRWAPFVEQLRADVRCVAVDLPGFGESPAEGCDALSAAAAVHEVVDRLGLVQPALVGHSLGSTVALLYGALFEARSIVAIDAAPLYTPHLTETLIPFRERLRGDDFDAAFEEWELATFDTGPLSESQLAASMIRPQPDVVLAYWANLIDRDRAESGVGAWSDALAGIPCPVLMLLANELSAADETIVARMPAATVEVWAGQGHWLHLANPDRFVARLRAWLAVPTG